MVSLVGTFASWWALYQSPGIPKNSWLIPFPDIEFLFGRRQPPTGAGAASNVPLPITDLRQRVSGYEGEFYVAAARRRRAAALC